MVDRPKGGEYDIGTIAFCIACGEVEAEGEDVGGAGLNDETGRVTTLVLELGRRVNAVENGFFEAWSTSAGQLK